jgi:hypothetical protein
MDAVRIDSPLKIEALCRFDPIPEKGLGLFFAKMQMFCNLF